MLIVLALVTVLAIVFFAWWPTAEVTEPRVIDPGTGQPVPRP